MAQKYCKACGKELIPGKEFCSKCLVRVPTEVNIQYLQDTPENRARNLKEYKVITQEDALFEGGRLNPKSLEKALNSYALEGWTVKQITTNQTSGNIFPGSGNQIIIIFERDLPLLPVSATQ